MNKTNNMGIPCVIGDKDVHVKISSNPETAEAIRQNLVPNYYEACPFRRVTTKPYDHLTEETPLFVECRHIVFEKQNYGECLGQCALRGSRYGYMPHSGRRGW